jgi:hypothetical protein
VTPVEVLRGARELLADKKRWARETYARDAEGNSVESLSRDAICWCVAGAIERVARGTAGPFLPALLAFARANEVKIPSDDEVVELACMRVGTYNDSSEHAAIVQAFDKAIASVEAK